jgi:hypothetical protein
MTLSPAKPSALRVDRDEGDEDEVRLDQWRTAPGLHDPERPGLKGVAGTEAEGLGRIGEAGESDDSADRARLFHCQQWADFASKRVIARDDGGMRQERGQLLCELAFEQLPMCIVERSDVGFPRVQGSLTQGVLVLRHRRVRLE